MNPQLLVKLIDKAEKNGFKPLYEWFSSTFIIHGLFQKSFSSKKYSMATCLCSGEYWKLLIFNHEFARALFGIKKFEVVFYCGVDHPCKYEHEANKIGYKNGGTEHCKLCDSIYRDTSEMEVNEGWEETLQKLVILSDEDIIKELSKCLEYHSHGKER